MPYSNRDPKRAHYFDNHPYDQHKPPPPPTQPSPPLLYALVVAEHKVGIYWGYIGGYIGVMEKNMETTTTYRGLYRDDGKWKQLNIIVVRCLGSQLTFVLAERASRQTGKSQNRKKCTMFWRYSQKKQQVISLHPNSTKISLHPKKTQKMLPRISSKCSADQLLRNNHAKTVEKDDQKDQCPHQRPPENRFLMVRVRFGV